uniref:competence protein CoiA family protein n=1 Tax=Streptosporangium sp. CA-256172 TaxID=3240076 RepID=UPI003F49B1ED
MECMQTRPNCPEWMFLTERDGVRFASHYNRNIKDHASQGESDQHKAFKERIAAAAELGGHVVETEDRAVHGKRRTDVLVKGAGLTVGWEIQLSYATLASVRKRAKIARGDGITPLWAITDPTAPFIDQVPWARTDDMPWQHISTGRELFVRGGVRALRMERCDERNPRPCPVQRVGRCYKWHGKWDLDHPFLDDLVRGSAAGQFVPILVPQGRSVYRWWTSPADRDRYADSVGGLLSEDDLPPRKQPAPMGEVAPRPVDTECRYGQDSGYRADPAIVRDSGDVVDASAVTMPDLYPSSPDRRVQSLSSAVCGAGAGPCGVTPARFYACGWRCEQHTP